MTIMIVSVISVIIVVLDQIIKYFVYQQLSPDGRVTVIDGLFSLVYTENRGAAFGIFQNATWAFAVLTVVLIAVFVFLMVKKVFTGRLFTVAVALIAGGGIGNLIDRLFRGFVIDYLSVSFFPPVCNFADYCITIGAALFVIAIFLHTDNKKASDEKPDEEQNI